jgi:isopentenyl phosphate kinase
MNNNVVFLKLGGSLITVKNQPHTPRHDMIERLAQEISQARAENQKLKLLLGHGAGSYGHVPAEQHHTRQGVKTAEDWHGFVDVWRQMAELSRLVMQALSQADVPALAFPPSAMVDTRGHGIASWNLEPILSALENGLVPVVHGDVVFDQKLGGTILSTEELFAHLAAHLEPGRLLLAGSEPGVWQDYPANTTLLKEITPATFTQVEPGLKGSSAPDVTGGMADKVRQVLWIIEHSRGTRACIFSGVQPGNVCRALSGEALGTLLHAE